MLMIQVSKIYSYMQIIGYSFQQQIYFLIALKNNYYIGIKLICILMIGVLTSLNPCFLSSIPLLVSYVNLNCMTNWDKTFVILGLSSSLLMMICSIYLFNYKTSILFINLPIISSCILILIALNLLQILDISRFTFTNDFILFNYKNFRNQYLQSYSIGFVVGLGLIPCNIGVIFTTISWFNDSLHLMQSYIFLFIYLIGCMFPFVLAFYLPFQSLKIKIWVNLWHNMIPLSGAFILSFACFSLLNNLFI